MLKGQTIGVSESLLIALVGMTVVIAVLAIIAVFILFISKFFAAVEKAKAKKVENAPVAAASAAATVDTSGRKLADTESQGSLKLENVDEPTAAVIMAIVSNQSGIPLNRLAFKSIKLIEEN